ncbi:hypothetical protein P12x_002037 [Tundrisphaera lichenicola]|uniref:hypothetical protein n=1 Tax=Tundrisphaera lichenicola TaxID=2029860 RepID=UPI003EB85137
MSDPAGSPSGAARLAYFTPVREYPPLGDRKASALLTAYGLMVTVLLTFSQDIGSIVSGENRWAAVLLLGILAPLAVLILIGAWYAFLALTRTIPPMPNSLAFYPHIAAQPLGGYLDRVKSLDQSSAVSAMLHYNYSLATLSVLKFRLIDRSIACVRATFKLWVVLMLMVALFD